MNARKDNRPSRLWILTPTLGICLFGLLYVLAAYQYPGGSNDDRMAEGFSWQHNYWCDLLGNVGKNGVYNPARPIALTAMLVLGASISLLWWLLPYLYQRAGRFTQASRWVGVPALLVGTFLDTSYHDLVINVAGGFMVVALVTTFVGLYRNRLFFLIAFGLLSVVLIGLNNYVYYTHHYLTYLPILQKITFVSFLSWLTLVNWIMYQRIQQPTASTSHS